MQYKNRYLYYAILPFCLLLIMIAVYVFGYNPPTQNPPLGNLPAPINAGPNPQTKEGDLTVEGNFTTKGILKLGQFNTADLPAGVEGALCFNTTKNIIQIYTLGTWRDLTVTKLGLGETCSLDGDCDLGHCVDGVCCNGYCEGTCNRCNVAGSLGSCIEAPSDCAGGCSICSSGNCIADPTKCTGNCVQCTGSGANYSCSANNTLCTGTCSFCNGSGTEYSCAGSHGFCSSTTGSCYCSGSGTVWNCQSCPDCLYATCSNYICSASPLSVTFSYKGSSVTYGIVKNATTGKCWMDRNLGALQVATAYNDANAYGDLFQWGRLDDGHQTRTSGTTATLSSTDIPGHSNFITAGGSPYDWRSPQNNNLWQGVSGINNPCPSGWRIPTFAELNDERASWSQQNLNGAFASVLKFTTGGSRYFYGSFESCTTCGSYWSSTVTGNNILYLYFGTTYAATTDNYRATSFSIRCVQD